eukprot:356847-Chlamydomonas_euryale.AAC.2
MAPRLCACAFRSCCRGCLSARWQSWIVSGPGRVERTRKRDPHMHAALTADAEYYAAHCEPTVHTAQYASHCERTIQKSQYSAA